jgi:hypothetical protein
VDEPFGIAEQLRLTSGAGCGRIGNVWSVRFLFANKSPMVCKARSPDKDGKQQTIGPLFLGG